MDTPIGSLRRCPNGSFAFVSPSRSPCWRPWSSGPGPSPPVRTTASKVIDTRLVGVPVTRQ